MLLVLSDSKRMNKKLISLFQGTLAAMSDACPVSEELWECSGVCASVFTMGCFQTVIFTMNRYSSTDKN